VFGHCSHGILLADNLLLSGFASLGFRLNIWLARQRKIIDHESDGAHAAFSIFSAQKMRAAEKKVNFKIAHNHHWRSRRFGVWPKFNLLFGLSPNS
jgi:hypothetical protein